ncbi:hypothetical protein RDV64_15360 [Acuticoccus sp. MNP-M23]|uniref:hypothetical protein n=1 Tax=Acuticoccus sp. MNP-M23 TaxID=3072793 RepID=UPI002814B223|nr:hypothetical protein [Acuticoccus sp. MNP-M23]WMS41451.1 hypothetical protein RDV64_15360 [Acuticoccus sp. MNP-M23]
MPTVYLHCGAPKTGTSFLQILFARYQEQLLAGNIVYPSGSHHEAAMSGKITSGNGVALANYLDPSLPHKIDDKNAFINVLEQTLSEADGKDVLYSSEFITFARRERAETLANVIQRSGYSARTIYFVRDIGNAARASYIQRVKRHAETLNFREYLETWDCLYRDNIRFQKRTFSRANIAILNYETEKHRIAELMFRDILGQSFVPSESTVINRSLTEKEIELMRMMNGLYPAERAQRLATFVSDALMEIPKETEAALDQAELDLLQEKFSDDVAFVNRFIQGPTGIGISRETVQRRADVAIDDFETTVIAVLAKVVATVDRGKRQG